MNYPATQTSFLRALVGVIALATAGCASLKPVQVVDVTGPDSLMTNQQGEFSATVGPEDATQPVFGTWSFGDGETAEGFEASHSFEEGGTYTVTFTATNQRGDETSSDTGDHRVVVKRPISTPSIVSMTFDPKNPDTHSSVTFSATIRDDEREVTGYTWSFGDGTESTAKQPSHTYENAETYKATLSVENSAGSDARTVSVAVEPYEAEICRDLTDLNPAFFDRNSSALSDESNRALGDNLEILNTCPNICVTIAGYSDPGERRADELSRGRANAVQTYYLDGGIPASRLSSEGRGRVDSVSQKEGLAQIRRADSLPNRCGDM